MQLLQTIELANGLKLSIFNHTKVYFGDYHHVRLRVVCSCCQHSDRPDSDYAPYTRNLEKMGVPSQDVDIVIDSLLKDFQKNSLPYLSSPEFPQRMIESRLAKKGPVIRKFFGAPS